MSIAKRAVELVASRLPEYEPVVYCKWCAPSEGGAGYCVCNEPCGESVCPHEDDVFVSPPVPIFVQEAS